MAILNNKPATIEKEQEVVVTLSTSEMFSAIQSVLPNSHWSVSNWERVEFIYKADSQINRLLFNVHRNDLDTVMVFNEYFLEQNCECKKILIHDKVGDIFTIRRSQFASLFGSTLLFDVEVTDQVIVNPTPTIISIIPPLNGDYSFYSNNQMNFQVNFSEAVEVGVAVRLRLNVGGQFRDAIAVSGNTTSSVIFRYEVQSVSEYDLNGISIVGFVSDPIGSPNYYIRSVATSVNADLTLPIVDTSGVLVNSLTPSITSITNNRTGENLSTGSVILFTVTYDYPIETTGSVQLDLEIGSTARYADILPSSDTFTRQFTYTIQSGDLDVDGLRIMSINLNGGSITSPAGVSADNSFSPIQTDVTVGSAPAPEWTIRTTPSGAWNRIIYGLDKFIVVGNNDAIMYSSDGITWSSSSFTDPVLSGANWQGVCYSPDLDKYVAVANTGTKRVATSLDGITWTLQDAAVNTTWISVAYGAGVFSAVSSTGTTNRIMYSSDGITWSTSGVTTGSVAIGTAYHITYQSGWFLISRENTSINESRIIKSTNGINYSNSLIQTGSQNPITTEVLYGTTHFVGVAKTGSARRSTDTSTWTTSAYPVLGVGEIPNTFQGLTYGVRPSNSTPYYFAVTQNRASSQVMYANADGSTWNILTSPPTTANGWRSIAYANGMLIIVNNGTYGSASQRVMTYNLI